MNITKSFLLSLCIIQFSQAMYFSQNQQDRFIRTTFFPHKNNGTFVEIGAHNGIKFSNTFFFEQIGWKGICIEPITEVFEQLCKNRTCICINGCIADFTGEAQFLHVKGHCEMLSGLIHKFDPRHIERIKREATANRDTFETFPVYCFNLNDLLKQYNFFHIDFLSIDTEGGELDIIKSIDFDTYSIDVICIEDNYGYPEIQTFLESKGFALTKKLECDLIFRNKKTVLDLTINNFSS